MVGKNLISGALLTVLRRPVYASGHYRCPYYAYAYQGKVGTGTILSSPRRN